MRFVIRRIISKIKKLMVYRFKNNCLQIRIVERKFIWDVRFCVIVVQCCLRFDIKLTFPTRVIKRTLRSR